MSIKFNAGHRYSLKLLATYQLTCDLTKIVDFYSLILDSYLISGGREQQLKPLAFQTLLKHGPGTDEQRLGAVLS